MSFNQAARVSAYVDDTGIFNNLPSLREANARLRFQMEKMGGDSDFATLK